MTATPRTDNVSYRPKEAYPIEEWCYSKYSRALESELFAANAEAESLKSALPDANYAWQEKAAEVESLKAQLAECRDKTLEKAATKS